jgi:CubicO group peptidase (beta-lactamase class C family)
MNFIQKLLKRLFKPGKATTSSPNTFGPEQAREILEQLYLQQKIPGLAIQVNLEGSPVLNFGIGMANLEETIPVEAEKTVFRIASVSKPITATALARLVASGLIDLEDPLQKYVPEYPQMGIRIRHLAAHTAGIRGYKGKEYALNEPLDIEGGMHLFLNDPLVFKPGKGYLYNSFDSVLLSLAMQRAAGMSFADIVEREVLKPLGMVNTFVEVPGQPVPGQAISYTRFVGGFRLATPVDNRYKQAGGGYLSTVGDLCRLGEACLNGQIVPQALLSQFTSGQMIKGKSTWYGLGWQLGEDIPGAPYYGHIGNGVGAYNNFFVYPQQKMVVSILINCTDPKVQPELNAAIEALHDFYSFQS